MARDDAEPRTAGSRKAEKRKRILEGLKKDLDGVDYELSWRKRPGEKEGAKDLLRQALADLKAVDSNHKVGLALSGGGYRASLFHLGALWRLNELGWLPKLDYVTSVSGGSIVAAFLGMRWSQLGFEKAGNLKTKQAVAKNFESVFVEPMREMFATTIDVQSIGRGLLNPWGSIRGRMDGKSLTDGTVGLLGEVAGIVAGGTGKSIATSLARPFAPLFATGIDAAATAWDALNPFPTPTELLIKTYDRLLFHGRTLQDLPDYNVPGNPRFILYATNMQTGVSVRMSRERIADYRLGEVKKPDVPLARAVAASSGFPPFYTPVDLKIPTGRWSSVNKTNELSQPTRARLQEKMDLADGAVYDNMGLTKLMKNCETILVSDAGDSLDVLETLPFEWLSQAVRTLEVAMDQSNKLRYGRLLAEIEHKERKGTYWGISQEIKKRLASEDKDKELLVDNERTRALAEMRTRLNRFTDEEQENLINWGYSLADARMRRWVIEPEDVLAPGKLPFPGRLQ